MGDLTQNDLRDRGVLGAEVLTRRTGARDSVRTVWDDLDCFGASMLAYGSRRLNVSGSFRGEVGFGLEVQVSFLGECGSFWVYTACHRMLQVVSWPSKECRRSQCRAETRLAGSGMAGGGRGWVYPTICPLLLIPVKSVFAAPGASIVVNVSAL